MNSAHSVDFDVFKKDIDLENMAVSISHDCFSEFGASRNSCTSVNKKKKKKEKKYK